MTTFADDFTSGSTVALASHPPSGPNAGSAWVQQIAGGAINCTSSGYITDNANNNGNRFKLNDSLGTDVMIVQMDVTWVSGSPAGGVLGRLPGTTGSTAIEFYYDWSDQKFHMQANSLDSPSPIVSWPSGTKTLRLECRTSSFLGFADGVQQCSYTAADSNAGGFYGGVILLNFAGGAVGLVRGDNFSVSTIPTFVPAWKGHAGYATM